VNINAQTAVEWSELEVAQPWTRRFTGPVLIPAFVAGEMLDASQQRVVA
jgi:hypothetical protein